MTAAPRTVSRRAFLGRALATGGAAALAPAALAAAATAPAPRRLGNATTFFANDGTNFQLLFSFGGIAYGAAEYGELAAAVNRVNERGATYDAIYDVFARLGARLRGMGDEARRAGRRVTARSRYLRSAEYLSQPLFFVLGTREPGREAAAYRAMQASFARAMRLMTPPAVPMRIPYEGGAMPGWLLRPDDSGRRRPTVILNNGSDGQNIDLYAFGAAAAVERGWNALILEGPGQGSMLFLRGIPFRPDWEKVVTPVVDALTARRDVDPRRIAIVGWSMGGELVARAAAFERRLAAVVVDPGVLRVIASWSLPADLMALVDAGRRGEVDAAWADAIRTGGPDLRFEIAKRSEIFRPRSAFDLLSGLKAYDVTDLVPRIEAPTLVLEPQGERFWPGQGAEVFRLLRSRKEYHRFTAAEGAQLHCEPMAPQVRNEVVFDWLERVVG